MRAVSRFVPVLLSGALSLAPAVAIAQEAPPAASSDTPATDAIGPRDLQNFSLNGTVTRAADQPATAPAPQQRQPRTEAQSSPPSAQSTGAPAQRTASAANATPAAPQVTETASAQPAPSPRSNSGAEAPSQSAASSLTTALPTPAAESASAAPTSSSAAFAPEPTPGTLAPEHRVSFLPWLLAALALGAGGAFLFWRNRQRETFAVAGGPQVDAFVAPDPEPAPAPRPAPAPAPAPPKAAAPASMGIVSTRLRPWIEIGFHPLRTILEDERVTVEFELELFNSGSAPARAVLAEASLFNAGQTQEREIGNFFANPVAQGERIAVIPPLKRVSLKTQVVAPRAQLQAYELAGHEVFVPIIGFNALYSWSGGEGQTSVSYLLGRDTKGEKMAPFRLDLGPRIFRGIVGKLLPEGVRQ